MVGDDLVPVPDRGRVYRSEREVRLGDADVRGRLRLDALARYLQDVANDDARESLGEDAAAWVVRRTVVDVFAWPRLAERLHLATFLGGVGSRWAERRTSVRGPHGHVECASVWVHIDVATGRPVALPERFLPIYGEVHGDRRVSGRLVIDAPAPGAERRPWPLRATDFDVLGHMNNAVYWAIAEEALPARAPARYELEHRLAVEPEHRVDLVRGQGHAWLAAGDVVYAAARVTTR